jgi:hypothetical protein
MFVNIVNITYLRMPVSDLLHFGLVASFAWLFVVRHLQNAHLMGPELFKQAYSLTQSRIITEDSMWKPV